MLPSQISYKDLQVRLQTLGCCLGDKTAIYNEALELGKDCSDKLEKLAYAISLYKVIRDYNTDLVLIPAIEGVQEEVAYENQEDGNCITIEQADIIFQYLQDYCKDCFREYGYYDTGILPSNDSGGWVGSSGIYVVSRQIQANWTQTNTDAVDFIKNKSLFGYIEAGTNVTITGAGTILDPFIIAASGGGGGSMTYPGAGLAKSTGSAWATSVTDNSANWNTAYGWGNHASAGYLTDAPSDGKTYGRKDAGWSEVVSTGGVAHGTASGTDTYAVTITGVAAYTDGDAYLIRFTNGNTTSATLNINTLGAKSLYRNNDGALIGGDIVDGAEMLCVYNSTLGGFQVIGTAPNTLLGYVTNDDSVTLTKGMPVYAFSGTGDRMTVKRALNTGDSTSAQTVGLVLSSSIAAGQKGLIMMQGLLDGLSILKITDGFADGDAIYLGASAGTITNVKPTAPNHLVYLGVVTTANNGSSGRMYVRVQNGYELEELHDVADANYSTPLDVDSLLIKDDATSLWKKLTWANLKSTLKTYFDTIYQAALGYTAENTANKSSSYTLSSTTTYANTKALVDGLATKMTNPMTTVGDMISGGSSGTPTRVEGNTTTTKKFLISQATSPGTATAPVFDVIALGDLPTNTLTYQIVESTNPSSLSISVGTYHLTKVNINGQSSAINITGTTGSPVDGAKLEIQFKSPTAAAAITWGSAFIDMLQTRVATLTNAKDSYIFFEYNATTSKWCCLAAGTQI